MAEKTSEGSEDGSVLNIESLRKAEAGSVWMTKFFGSLKALCSEWAKLGEPQLARRCLNGMILEKEFKFPV